MKIPPLLRRQLALAISALLLFAAWGSTARAAEPQAPTEAPIQQEIVLAPNALARFLLLGDKASGAKPSMTSANTADCTALFNTFGIETESALLHTDTGQLVINATPGNLDLVKSVLATNYHAILEPGYGHIDREEIALTPDVLARFLQANKTSGAKPSMTSANTADCKALFQTHGISTESAVLHTDTGQLVINATPGNLDRAQVVLEADYGRIEQREIALTPDVLARFLLANKTSGAKPSMTSANTADCKALFNTLGVPIESAVLHTDTGKLVINATSSYLDLAEETLEVQYDRK